MPKLTTDKTSSFDERRQLGRQLAGKLQHESETSGKPLDWFEGLYEAADGDLAKVPWAGNPHKALLQWIENNVGGNGATAIDVGCGLGDNALELQKAGFDTTAFDLSETAIEWAKKRHSESGVHFQQGDLFELPSDWHEAFEFVHETYTIQALKGDFRAASFEKISQLVKPGGLLLVICRSIADGVDPNGPPWPLTPTELTTFEQFLTVKKFEEIDIVGERTIPHFRVLYEKKSN